MSATAAAIKDLLTEYVKFPLMRLREINQQAELSNLMMKKLAKAGDPLHTTITISSCGTGGVRAVQSDASTQRVQQELKVRASGDPAKDRSDVVLLKCGPDHVHLKRERNGTLDVVAGVSIECVDSIVEIKAACSFDPVQRHLFRRDVVKMLELIRAAPSSQYIEAHFVLIDKSLPVGPHTLEFGPSPVLDWERGFPRALRIRKKINRHQEVVLELSPQLTLASPGARDGRYVNVWDLDADLQVRHRVCSEFELSDDDSELGIVSKAKKAPNVGSAAALA